MQSLESQSNNKNQQLETYYRLELVYPEESRPKANQNWLRVLGKQLIDFLTPSDEPIISRHVERTGHIWWNVYNRATGQSLQFGSENALLVWLDQYHNCN